MIRTTLSVLLIATASAIKLRARDAESAADNAPKLIAKYDDDKDGMLNRDEFGKMIDGEAMDPALTGEKVDKLYDAINTNEADAISP